MHEGIDIAARSGTPVHAAEAGHVIYASRLGGYGNVVVVRHGKLYETVYAHNRRFRVQKGARVRKGDVIAEVGATGNASAPHVHFEVRRQGRPARPATVPALMPPRRGDDVHGCSRARAEDPRHPRLPEARASCSAT